MRFKKFGVGCLISLILFLFIGLFVYSRLEWIEAGHVGIMYSATHGIDKNVYPPKRVFVGWRQQLYQYPTKMQNAIYSQDPSDGEQKAADGIQITTSDNNNLTFDVSVIYRVRREDALTVFSKFGAIDIGQIQIQHIRRAVKDAVNEVGPQYDTFALIGPNRLEASNKLTQRLQEILGPKGITIISAYLETYYPNQDMQMRVLSRVNANTQYKINLLHKQIATIDSQIAKIRNQAEAKYNQITSKQSSVKSLELLSLETDALAIEKWDGHLPALNLSPNQPVILGNVPLTVPARHGKGGGVSGE